MAVVLTIIAGPGAGQSWRFEEPDALLAGRAPECRLGVGPDLKCSRFHLILGLQPPLCRLRDLGSLNGTFVNGLQVREAELRHGDVIRLGGTQIQVSMEEGQEAAPTSVVAVEAFLPDPFGSGACGRCGRVAGPPRGGGAGDTPLCRNCVAQMAAAGEDLPGVRLEEQLDQGGEGFLWRAEDTVRGGLVAVKLLRPDLARQGRLAEVFRRGCRIALSLEHPRIVRALAAGQYQGQLYLVMEYIEAPDADRLQRGLGGRLPVADAVEIACQTLEALAFAHDRGIVHRDIKPANLLVAGEPGGYQVKVADFGIARDFREQGLSGLTSQGEARGSLDFMPPEQLLNCRGVDWRCDLFSLGATLYCLLTGATPYDFRPEREPEEATVAQGRVVPIEQRRADLPADLCTVLRRSLARERDDRFQSAEEMRQALRGVGR